MRCTNYDIHVIQQPEIVRPNERATFTSVPGRSGTLTTLEADDVYDDFILSVECFISDLNMLSAIFGWLRGSGTVTFANRQGGFYHARIVNQISLEQVLRGNPHRTFAINFRCQPFFYIKNVADIALSTGGYQFITNLGEGILLLSVMDGILVKKPQIRENTYCYVDFPESGRYDGLVEVIGI